MASKVDFLDFPQGYDSIVTTPINVYSCFFMVPYRLKWKMDTNTFTAASSCLQKLICRFFYVLFLGTRLWHALSKFNILHNSEHSNFSTTTQTNPIFTQVGALPGIFVVPLLVTWLSWNGQNYFAVVATNLKKIIPGSQLKRKLFTIFFSVVPFINAGVTFQEDVLKNQYSVFNSPVYYSLDKFVDKTVFTLVQFIILAFGFIVHLIDLMFEFYGVFILSCVLVYTGEFCKQLSDCLDMKKSRSLMKNMQDFVSMCNEDLVLGAMTLCTFVEVILLTSQSAERFLFSSGVENLYLLMKILPFQVMSVSFWIMAAEVYRKIHHAVDEWIEMQQDSESLTAQEKILALGIGNDFQRKNAGISNRFFVITYSFVGSMIGIMMTYILIANQSIST